MNVGKKIREIGGETLMLFRAFKHPKTPWYSKIFIGLAVLYALSPIDLIPDFIPGLGYLDDAIILPSLIALAKKSLPKEILSDTEKRKKRFPKNASGILLILILLGALLFLIVRMIKN